MLRSRKWVEGGVEMAALFPCSSSASTCSSGSERDSPKLSKSYDKSRFICHGTISYWPWTSAAAALISSTYPLSVLYILLLLSSPLFHHHLPPSPSQFPAKLRGLLSSHLATIVFYPSLTDTFDKKKSPARDHLPSHISTLFTTHTSCLRDPRTSASRPLSCTSPAR
jgi:hypothetical protein